MSFFRDHPRKPGIKMNCIERFCLRLGLSIAIGIAKGLRMTCDTKTRLQSDIDRAPRVGEVWKHIKSGNYYRISGLAINVEGPDGHEFVQVLYQPDFIDGDRRTYTRSLDNFLWINGRFGVKRFERVGG